MNRSNNRSRVVLVGGQGGVVDVKVVKKVEIAGRRRQEEGVVCDARAGERGERLRTGEWVQRGTLKNGSEDDG